MYNPLLQGLIVSILGMTFLFAAMGLLILAMTVLERLFRPKTAQPDPNLPDQKIPSSSTQQATKEAEIAAAIATALLHLRSLEIHESGLGSTLETGPSRWWFASRAHQSPADAMKINRWRN